MITDPVFYVTAIAAVLIVGIAKGGLAGGIGIVGVPMMAMTIGPIRAAAIMLPILMLMDIVALRTYWRKWDSTNLRYIIPGAFIGTAVGWICYQYLSADLLRLLIGVIAIGFAGNYFLKPAQLVRFVAHRGRATLWASLSGVTSFAIHAGGPPLHAYLLPQQLNRTTFQATTVAFFFLINWLKIVPYGFLGQLDSSNLLTSLVLAPLAPIGIKLGAWLHTRINEKKFFTIVYSSLLALGTKLTYDAIDALFF